MTSTCTKGFNHSFFVGIEKWCPLCCEFEPRKMKESFLDFSLSLPFKITGSQQPFMKRWTLAPSPHTHATSQITKWIIYGAVHWTKMHCSYPEDTMLFICKGTLTDVVCQGESHPQSLLQLKSIQIGLCKPFKEKKHHADPGDSLFFYASFTTSQ